MNRLVTSVFVVCSSFSTFACGGLTLPSPSTYVQDERIENASSTYWIDTCTVNGTFSCTAGPASQRIEFYADWEETSVYVDGYKESSSSMNRQNCLKAKSKRSSISFDASHWHCSFSQDSPTGSYAVIAPEGGVPFKMTLVENDRILFELGGGYALLAQRTLRAEDRNELVRNGVSRLIVASIYQ